MLRSVLCAVLLGLPAVSLAIPSTLSTQGRLLDSVGGPVEGASNLTFSIYDDADATNPALWDETVTVALSGGYYQVTLGLQNPLTASLFHTDGTLYLGIAMDGDPELQPRQALLPTAYAVVSDTAVNVDGGTVSATTVSATSVTADTVGAQDTTTSTLTTDSASVGGQTVSAAKIVGWDATNSAWGTSGITVGDEVSRYEANGASGATNLGAANGRRMCFLTRVQFHDTFRNESLGDCYVQVSGSNWRLFVNADNGDGDPDIRCSARCLSW